MASALYLEDLTCAICLTIFTDPVNLLCGHSFCRGCITDVLSSQHQCPQCRTAVLTEGKCLPTSHILKSLAEKAKEAEKTQKERGSEKAQAADLCPEHEEKLKLFCDTDQQLACIICRDGERHKGHKFKPIKEAAASLRQELEKVMKNLCGDILATESRANTQREEITKTKEKSQQLTTQICKQFEEMHQFLRKREDEIKTELKLKEEDAVEKMGESLNAIETALSESRELESKLTSVLKIEDSEKFLKSWTEGGSRVTPERLFRPRVNDLRVVNISLSLGPYESHLQFFIWKEMLQVIQPRAELLSLKSNSTDITVSDDGRSLFGTPKSNQTSSGPSSAFGSAKKSDETTVPLFGSTTRSDQTTVPLFGSTKKPDQTTVPLFGSTTRSDQTTVPLFGSTTRSDQTTVPLFGSTTRSDQTTVPLFGSTKKPDQTRVPLFGSTTRSDQTTVPLFGSTKKPDQTTVPLFGSTTRSDQTTVPLFGSTTRSDQTTVPLFGSTKKQDQTRVPLFGSTMKFGQTTVPPFGSNKKSDQTSVPLFGSTTGSGQSTGFKFGSTGSDQTSSTGFGETETPPSFIIGDASHTILKQCEDNSLSSSSSTRHVFSINEFTSGQHYWEVEVGHRDYWELGIKDNFLKYDEKKYATFSPDRTTEVEFGDRPRKIGIYLNCASKKLSFYDADNMTHIHTVSSGLMSVPLSAHFNIRATAPDLNPLTVCWY